MEASPASRIASRDSELKANSVRKPKRIIVSLIVSWP